MENQELERCIYLEEIQTFADLELRVISLISTQMQNFDIFESYQRGKVLSREISLAGYYCNLETTIITPYSRFIGTVDLYIGKESVGGGMLFFESGILKFIEAYFWGENDFFLTLEKQNHAQCD